MPRDGNGRALAEGDRVVIEAIVEEIFPISGSDSVEIRLIVPPGQHAPNFVIEAAALRKLDRQEASP